MLPAIRIVFYITIQHPPFGLLNTKSYWIIKNYFFFLFLKLKNPLIGLYVLYIYPVSKNIGQISTNQIRYIIPVCCKFKLQYLQNKSPNLTYNACNHDVHILFRKDEKFQLFCLSCQKNSSVD